MANGPRSYTKSSSLARFLPRPVFITENVNVFVKRQGRGFLLYPINYGIGKNNGRLLEILGMSLTSAKCVSFWTAGVPPGYALGRS